LRQACLLFVFSLSCAILAHAATPPFPAPPTFSQLPLRDSQELGTDDDGSLRWIGSRLLRTPPSDLPKACSALETNVASWNPANGKTSEIPLGFPIGSFVYQQLPLAAGTFALLLDTCQSDLKKWRFIWVPRDERSGPPLMLETKEEMDGFYLRFLQLGEDAAALVTRENSGSNIRVYVIRREGGQLKQENMPQLDIPTRRDFATALTNKGQLWILGGSNSKYRGCDECRSETHILDLQSKKWRNGPPMLEARSELAASALPDGSILVTGGWTKAAGWGEGPSRTAERWNPQSNRFEALPPMPIGHALHRHMWWNAPWGKTLLVGVGTTGAVDAYDPSTNSWRNVGSWPSGSEEGGCALYPFVVDGTAYAWLWNRSEGYYSSKSCERPELSKLSLMRAPYQGSQAPRPSSESLRSIFRKGAATVAARGAAPAMLIGGVQHAGMNNYPPSAAVEAVTLDGRVSSMPTLRIPRERAHAFRLGDGVLVLGGVGPKQNDESQRPAAEWLPSMGSPGWQLVDGLTVDSDTALTQLKNGSLLSITADGMVRQLTFTPKVQNLAIEQHTWPAKVRPRNAPGMKVRELDDGRIVVAGGPIVNKNGEEITPKTYEIFDWARKRWSQSSPPTLDSKDALILHDGRVIIWGHRWRGSEATGTYEDKLTLEISSSRGDKWAPLPSTGSKLTLDSNYKVFEQDGELFARGSISDPEAKNNPVALEWFNTVTNQWERLWTGSGYDVWGRTIVRKLAGKNAQSKTVMLQVEGD